jgi:hypothetical protein
LRGGGEAVGEVVNKFGDPEAFAERELKITTDIHTLPIGTKLYSHPAPSANGGFPKSIHLDTESVKFMREYLECDDECVLWVGETEDGDNKTYGLQLYLAECPEEGSVCVAELDRHKAPLPVLPNGWEFDWDTGPHARIGDIHITSPGNIRMLIGPVRHLPDSHPMNLLYQLAKAMLGECDRLSQKRGETNKGTQQ